MEFIKHLEPYTYNYTGEPQTVNLIKGYYTFECWGANGSGGKGGYSVGELELQEEVTLFAYVGGDRTSTWNGGAGLNVDDGRSASGGASDLRLSLDDLYTRFIVAGGGAGAATRLSSAGNGAYTGGAGNGGGISGGSGLTSSETFGSVVGGAGATQTTGYSFGVGKAGSIIKGNTYYNILVATVSGSGGGGWFGGYSGNNSTYRAPNSSMYTISTSGGGGSGYVLTSDSYKPEGYSVSEEFYLINAKTLSYNEDGYIDKDADVTHGIIKISPKLPNVDIKIIKNNLNISLEMFRPYLDLVKVEIVINGRKDKQYEYNVANTNDSFTKIINHDFNLDISNFGYNDLAINIYDGDTLRYTYNLNYNRVPNISGQGDDLITLLHNLSDCNSYLDSCINRFVGILQEKGFNSIDKKDLNSCIEAVKELPNIEVFNTIQTNQVKNLEKISQLEDENRAIKEELTLMQVMLNDLQ